MTTAPPRVLLGTRQTPLEPAPRPARVIGLHAGDRRLKRDDLVGLGGGANKIRTPVRTVGAVSRAQELR